ncbi:MAG: hypothetical protein AUJ49_07535 [Desulfovibrionaceae bacterium CG1_02_65_16]|nr:MAG: hypothetical protein AUJ49_07535 [Desulfovibrionaceae bacterium CG1_02_65_16]
MRRRIPPHAAPSAGPAHRLIAAALPLCPALLLALLLASCAGASRPAPSIADPAATSPQPSAQTDVQTNTRANVQTGVQAQAEALLEDGPKQDPEAALALLADRADPAARLARIEGLRLLGRANEAVAEANRQILDGRRLPEAFVARARALADAGASDRALEDCGSALRLDPKNLDALLTQGDLFFAMELPVPAEFSYTRAIEAAPTEPLPYINRGVARDDQGRYDEAIADFDRAITLDPSSAAAYANRGVSRSQTGDLAGMCADYRRACALGQCRRLEDARAMGYCPETAGK